ncbi:unnamed protein product [Lampetra fluviatilis]
MRCSWRGSSARPRFRRSLLLFQMNFTLRSDSLHKWTSSGDISARVRTLTAGDVVVHARCVHAATSLKAPACHCGHEALASAPRKPRQPRGAHWRRARSARGGVLTRQRRCSSAAARRCYPRVGPAQRLSPRANGVRGRRRHMELVLRFLQLRRDSTALSALRHRCSFSLRLFLRPLDKALGMLER